MKNYKDKTNNHNYKEIYIDYEAEIKKDENPKKNKKILKRKNSKIC